MFLSPHLPSFLPSFSPYLILSALLASTVIGLANSDSSCVSRSLSPIIVRIMTTALMRSRPYMQLRKTISVFSRLENCPVSDFLNSDGRLFRNDGPAAEWYALYKFTFYLLTYLLTVVKEVNRFRSWTVKCIGWVSVAECRQVYRVFARGQQLLPMQWMSVFNNLLAGAAEYRHLTILHEYNWKLTKDKITRKPDTARNKLTKKWATNV